MSALPTRIEKEARARSRRWQIFDITAARRPAGAPVDALYQHRAVFMLLPGTFLGVWNLLAISSRRAANSVSPAWIQAHGHAQIFGWIGTFILGIGFYSIPKLRRLNSFALVGCVDSSGRFGLSELPCGGLPASTSGSGEHCLPLSAALELAAFAIFFRTVSGHRPQDAGKNKLEHWVFVVIAGSVGLLLTLLVNFGSDIVSRHSRNIARNTSRIRPTFSRSSNLGILGSLCLGIQRQMASRFSGTSPGDADAFSCLPLV